MAIGTNYVASSLAYTGNPSTAAIAFNPTTDTLNFDISTFGVSASRIGYTWSGSTLNLTYSGKTIALNMSAYYLSAGLNAATQPPIQLLTTSNVTFWNGTQLIVGDNTFGGPGTTGNDTQSSLGFNGTNVFFSSQDSISPGSGDQFASFGASPSMSGGAGDDVFNIHGPNNPENISQTFSINGGEGGDRVQLLASTAVGANVDLRNQVIHWGSTTINLSSVESVRGTALNDNFFGGQNGFQWVDLDRLNFFPGTPSVEFQTFMPNIGYDNIQGGGTGDGTRVIVDYSSGPARISMQAPFGDDDSNNYRQVTKYGPTDSIVGMDNLNDVTRIIGTNGADLLQGGTNARSVFGTKQEEFQGNGGADTINGYGSFDLALYGNAANAVYVNLAAGYAYDGSNINVNADSQGGGNVRDTLISIEGVSAGNGDDTIIGGAENNYMGGNAGSDWLDGGDGYDTASYQGSSGGVSAHLGAGFASDFYIRANDATVSIGEDTLINIEELRGSDFNDTLIGGSSSSTYLSPGGHPVEGFEGRAGDDLIIGLDFNQIVDQSEDDHFRTNWAKYQRSPEGVSIDLSMAIGQDSVTGAGGFLQVDDGYGGIDTLININGLEGSRFDDVLVGDNFRNALRGDAGNDIMDGGGGIDTVTYGNSPSDSGVFVDLDAGIAVDGWGYWNSAANGGTGEWVEDGFDTLINIENVQGSDFDDRINGDANANTIWGLGGSDILDSRDAGADTLYGGSGDDLYWIKAGDVVSEVTNDGVSDAGGHDEVFAFTNYTAGNYVEDVWLRGTSNATANGNTLANRLRGNAANNKLDGKAGNDTILGGLGNDTIIGGAGVDWASYDDVTGAVRVNLGIVGPQDTGGAGVDYFLVGANATENLEGSRFGDRLTGSSSANTIKGGNGSDTISGGLGLDILNGGNGRDSFLFDTAPAAGNADTIQDFTHGVDKIALDGGIFGALGDSVTSANFRTTTAVANAYLYYTPGNGKLYYDPTGSGNGNGDRIQIATVLSNGTPATLTASDFTITSPG